MTKRRLTCSVTVLLTANVVEESPESIDVSLTDARYSTIGYMSALTEAAAVMSEADKDVRVNAVVKLGLKALLDKMNGEHDTVLPSLPSSGASA